MLVLCGIIWFFELMFLNILFILCVQQDKQEVLKMMKRTLSLLMALIMVVGMLPNTMVFAADANAKHPAFYVASATSFCYATVAKNNRSLCL